MLEYDKSDLKPGHSSKPTKTHENIEIIEILTNRQYNATDTWKILL